MAITTNQLKALLDAKMNNWEEKEDDISYDNIIGKLADEFDVVYTSKSTRMLIQALEALESTGGLDFAVLKYPELGDTWSKYTRRREERRIRAAAVKKLGETFSQEELNLLGIHHLVK